MGVYWLTALQDGDPDQLAQLARFLGKQREPEVALLAFDLVHERHPFRFFPEHARLLSQLEPERAAGYLERAVRAQPREKTYRRLLAGAYESQERWSEAAAAWDRLALHDPEARYRAAKATYEASGAEEALLMLERARVRGERLHPESHLLKADLLALTGDPAGCAAAVVGSHLLDKAATRERARRVLDACGR